MHHSPKENLITTKDASELSGYTSDYLARLVRSGEIHGKRIGHSWTIDSASLEVFMSKQKSRKLDRARELASSRVREYNKHNQFVQRTARALTEKVSVPQFVFENVSLRSHAFALSIALAVVAVGAVGAHAAAVPHLAQRASALAAEISSGFVDTFGDVPVRIEARMEEARIAVRADETHEVLASRRAGYVASPSLASINPDTLRAVLVKEYRAPYATSGIALSSSRADTQILTVTDVYASVARAYELLAHPSSISTALASAYFAIGTDAYAAVDASFSAYRALVDDSGIATLAVAATARDTLARAPHLVTQVNLALGEAVIDVTHAAIHADVIAAHGLAAAAPASARVAVTLMGSVGDTLARATEQVPARVATAYLEATAAPATLAPQLAQAILKTEYEAASRFVTATGAVADRYLALVEGTGDLAYESTSKARAVSGATMRSLALAPAVTEDALLGALGKSAVALDSATHLSSFAPMLAAALPALSASERAALAVYEAIHSAFDSANRSLVAFFTTTPPTVLPTGVPKARIIGVATSTRSVSSGTQSGSTVSYPTYTTVVRGVSEDFMNQSLASLRTNVLATVAGMIQPVSNQVVQNITTIQQLNRIDSLHDLVVQNGDFRNSIFDSGIRVSATDGSFSRLSAGTTTLATTTINGTLTISSLTLTGSLSTPGAITGSYFVSTSTNATSTLAGSLNIDNAGFVYATTTRNVGIGVLSPAALLAVQNSSASQPIFVASNAAGAEVYRLTNAGFVGIGTTSPTYNLAVEGSSTLGNQAIAGYFTATTTTATSTFAGSLAVGTTSPTGNGLFTVGTSTPLLFVSNTTGFVGIGTTSPFAALSVAGNGFFNGNLTASNVTATGTLAVSGLASFALASTSQLSVFDRAWFGGSATSTFTSNGYLGILNSAPAYPLDVTGAGRFSSLVDASHFVATSSTATSTFAGGLAVGTSKLVVDSTTGSIGIGTTTPTALVSGQSPTLHIAGTLNPEFRLERTTGASHADASLRVTDNKDFVIAVKDGTASTIDAFAILSDTGNVGIGTTAPGGRLEIKSSGVGTWIEKYTNSAGTYVGGLYETAASHGQWYLADSAGTDKVVISANSGQATYFNHGGNVGIGTTTPAGKLTVASSGGANSGLTFDNNNSASYAPIDFTQNSVLASQITSSGSGFSSGAFGSDELTIAQEQTSGTLHLAAIGASGIIKFTTGANSTANERLRITAAGNVGIGTTAPGTKLDVNLAGNATLTNVQRNVSNNAIAISSAYGAGSLYGSGISWYTTDDNATKSKAGIWTQTTGSGSYLMMGTSNSYTTGVTNTAVTVDPSGNVGIGTASPQSKLNIVPGNDVEGVRVSGTSNTLGLSLAYTDAGTTHAYISNLYGGNAASDMQFQFGSTLGSGTVMTLLQSGNVGIGSTTPGYKLAVAGSAYFDGGTVIASGFTATSSISAPYFTATSASATSTFAGGLAVETNGLVYDYSTNNVGIGTASPGAKLDVQSGTAGLALLNLTETVGTQYGYQSIGNGTNSLYLGIERSTTGGLTTGSTAYAAQLASVGAYPLQFGTDDTVRMTILPTSGNVGIGTASPGSLLEVNGRLKVGISGTNEIVLANGGTDYGYIQSGGNDYWSLGHGPTVGTLGTEVLTWTKGGNVGIGTTNPGSKLEIVGAADAPSITAASGIFRMSSGPGLVTGLSMGVQSTPPYGTYLQSTNQPASGGGAYPLLLNPLGGNIGIGTTSPVDILSVGLATNAIGGLTVGEGSVKVATLGDASSIGTNGLLELYAAGTKTVQLHALSSQVSYINAGNVGIGTTNPLKLLHIGAGTDTPSIDAPLYIAGANDVTKQGVVIRDSTNDVEAYWRVYPAGTSQIGTYTNHDFTLAANGAEAVRVQSGGNVGIGTTAPGNKLAVVTSSGDDTIPALGSNGGKFALLDGGGAGAYGLIAGVLNTGNVFMQAQRVDGTATAYNLLLQPSGGNVGIGTTAPNYKLDVKDGSFSLSDADVSQPATSVWAASANGVIGPMSGTAGGLDITGISDTDAGGIYISGMMGSSNPTDTTPAVALNSYKSNGGTSVSALGAAETTLQIQNAGTPLLTVLGGGNVGIGTTAPGAKLDVGTGGLRITAAGSDTYASGGYIQLSNTAAAQAALQINASGNLGFWTDNGGLGWVQKMVLTNGGNVGIGTTSPRKLLEVSGAGDARIGFTDTNAAADNKFWILGPAGTSFFGKTVDDANNIARTWLNVTRSGTAISSIVFATNAGTTALTLDSSQQALFTGNVGIGTTTPDSLLTVNGSGRFMSQNPIVPTGGTSLEMYYAAATFSSTPSAYLISYDRTNSAYKPINIDASTVTLRNSGTAALTISSGNVSVGTAASVGTYGTLESWSAVASGASVPGNIAAVDTTAMAAGVGGQVTYAGQYINGTYTYAAYTRAVKENAVSGEYGFGLALGTRANGGSLGEVMRLTSTGNVGIGTTTPGSKLVISGQGTYGGLHIENVAGAAAFGPYVSVGADGYSSDSGTFRFQDKRATQGSPSFVWDVTDNSGTVLAYDFQGGASSRLAITQSGNVGIGTTNPGAKLHVLGGNRTQLMLDRAGNQVNRFAMFVGDGTDGYVTDENYIASLNTGLHFLGGATGTTENVTFLVGGNVGIGTTTPANILHTYAASTGPRFDLTGASDNNTLVLNQRNGYLAGGRNMIQFAQGTTPSTNMRFGFDYDSTALQIRSSADAALVTFANGGNVGIGTTTPDTKLVVDLAKNDASATYNLAKYFVGGGQPNAAYLTISGTTHSTASVRRIMLDAYQNDGTSAPLILQQSTGNVGIGTTNPQEKLSLVGGSTLRFGNDGDSGDNLLYLRGGTTGDKARITLNSYGYADWHIAAGDVGNGKFSITNTQSGTDGIIIDTSSNVGIEDPTPLAQLSVAGGTDTGPSATVKGMLQIGGSSLAQGLVIGSYTASPFAAYIQGLDNRSGGATTYPIVLNPIGGNVGIGTTSPAAELQIGAATHSLKFDYVGASDYSTISVDTADGADDKRLFISGGGGESWTRGATIGFYGNEYSGNAGTLELRAGSANGNMNMYVNGGAITLSGSGGEKFRMTDAGNIGIGTTSPIFDANSGSGATYLTVQSASTLSEIGVSLNQTSTTGYLGGYAFVNAGLATTEKRNAVILGANDGATNSGNIQFWTSSAGTLAERMRIDKSGNVGIGTTTPLSLLNVEAASGNAVLTLTTRSGPAIAKIVASSAGGGAMQDLYLVGGTASTQIRNNADSSTLVYIKNDGNVGIGTTGPNAKLTIGNNVATGFLDNYSEYQEILYDSGVAATSYGLGIKGNTMVFNSGAGAYSFDSAGTASRMVIDTSGNVGIGTTSPGMLLSLESGGAGQTGIALSDITGGKEWRTRVIGNGSSRNGNFSIQNFSDGLNVLEIDTVGNVGIGTTSPRSLLSVVGTHAGSLTDVLEIGTTGATGSTANGIVFSELGTKVGRIRSYDDGDSTASLRFDTYNSGTLTEKMVIKGAGNVGIGTTSPWKTLSVVGQVYTAGGSADGTSNAHGVVINNTGWGSGAGLWKIVSKNDVQGLAFYGNTAAASDFSTSVIPLFLEYSTGDVGINTTNPTQKLDVNGIITSNTGSSAGKYYIAANDVLSSASSALLSINAAGYTSVNISGNVGIGTTTPATKFEVGGNTANVTFDGYLNCTGFTSNANGLLACTASDERLKQNVVALDGASALAGLNALNPVSFYWNPATERSSSQQYGLIAQQVQTVFPNLVATSSPTALTPDGTLSVNYEGLISPMVIAIQELDARTKFISNAATSTVLTVDALGNVGIGTTTPTRTLSVAGDIGAIAFVNTSTRNAKTNIDYATASSSEDRLSQLVALKVATYRYTIEDQNDPLRLGLIAEDTQTIAPEILSADGKGVDIYELATFTLSGVQALAAKVDAQETRMISLENRMTALESGAVSSASGSPITFSTSSLASALEGFGVLIRDGIAQFNTLVFRQLVASRDADGTSSAGSVTIIGGNTVAQVTNSLVQPSTKVFVTFNSSVTGSWWVSDKTNGSFRVVLSAPQSGDVSFDYFLVQTEGQIATSTQTVSSGTTPSSSSGLDTTAPVITLLGDNPLHLSIGGTFVEPGVTVTDNADASVPYVTFVNGVELQATAESISTSAQTTYIITYSATDARGNLATATRSVIVGSTTAAPSDTGSTTTPVASADTTAPVVTLVGEAAIQLTVGDTFTDSGATATDDTDGDVTASIAVSGTVDTATEGLYTLTYTATDAAGNAGSVSRVVTVVAAAAAPAI